MRSRLGQLHQSGAEDGDVATWSSALGMWVPSSAGGTSAPPTSGEVLVVDGVSPPENLTTEDGTDYLYEG